MNKKTIVYLMFILAIIFTVLATINIQAAESYPRKIGPVGGPSTQVFDDSAAMKWHMPISLLKIGAGDVLDSIQAFYQNGLMPKHGGDGGAISKVGIEPGDYITEISGCYGNYFGAIQIGQITIKTHLGKSYGPYGAGKVNNKKLFSLKTATDKEQIIAFFGGSYKHTDGTNYISSLGAYITVLEEEQPIVITVPRDSHPAVPSDLKECALKGPDTLEPSPTDPVLKWHGNTYWAYSFIDNRYSMAIVAYDANGNPVQRKDKDGARYVWQITVDATNRTVTFWGQSSKTIVMKWDEL